VLATAALAAAEGGEATLDDALELEKAIVAPCNAELFREAGGANRGLAAAISPFISPVFRSSESKDREKTIKEGVNGERLETFQVALQLVRTAKDDAAGRRQKKGRPCTAPFFQLQYYTVYD
jgi:hypothetical protein